MAGIQPGEPDLKDFRSKCFTGNTWTEPVYLHAFSALRIYIGAQA